MACDNRQLSQTQRQAGYQQQRTGVVQALRPFSGAPTLENLLDYLNRELVPAVRATRNAANDIYLQVADNAPSANPLAYYFSTDTAASDPTVGRIKLDASPQDTATIIRVSESNARLQSVIPWLDVMSGGPTTPLGTVTLVDAVNPGRFLRFDLNTMTDQGTYWDLGVTFIEGSHDDPFVQDEGVVLGFISGVSAAGSTVPVGSLSPVDNNTVLTNISGASAPPSAVPWANLDSDSVIYASVDHELRRAALTGAIAAGANVNETTFAGIRDNGAAENNRTNLNFVSSTSVTIAVTDDAGNDELEISPQRAALTGFAEASANSNATTSAEPIVTYSASANMSAERVLTSSTSNTISTAVANQIAVERAALTGAVAASANSNATLFSGIRDNGAVESDRTNLNFVSSTSATLVVTDDAGNDELEITVQRAALTGEVTASANSNSTTITRSTNFNSSPWTGPHTFNDSVTVANQFTFNGVITPTALSANVDDYSPTGWETANIVRLSTNSGTARDLLGAASVSPGELKWLINLGPGLIRIQHEQGTSSASNRFLVPSGTTFGILVNGVCGILYDASSSRWRCIYPHLIT